MVEAKARRWPGLMLGAGGGMIQSRDRSPFTSSRAFSGGTATTNFPGLLITPVTSSRLPPGRRPTLPCTATSSRGGGGISWAKASLTPGIVSGSMRPIHRPAAAVVKAAPKAMASSHFSTGARSGSGALGGSGSGSGSGSGAGAGGGTRATRSSSCTAATSSSSSTASVGTQRCWQLAHFNRGRRSTVATSSR